MHRRPQQEAGEACELRWNVRLSHVETPQVLRQFQTAFEQYWEEGESEAYDPAAGAAPIIVKALLTQ